MKIILAIVIIIKKKLGASRVVLEISEKVYQSLPTMLINTQITYTKQNEVKYDAENWPLATKKMKKTGTKTTTVYKIIHRVGYNTKF